jgi:hypothetical protein
MLLNDHNIQEIIQDSLTLGTGLHMSAVEFQRDVLEYNFGVEKNYGCRYLATLSNHYSNDEEVIEAAKVFMFTCMKSYVNALKARSRLYKKGSMKKPSEHESMRKVSILEFFEGCCALS